MDSLSKKYFSNFKYCNNKTIQKYFDGFSDTVFYYCLVFFAME